jgi:hypothetical protein
MWDLWWTKWRWGRLSPSTSVSSANLHSTNFSTITITITQGWYNMPVVAAVPKVPPHKLKKKQTKKSAVRSSQSWAQIVKTLRQKIVMLLPSSDVAQTRHCDQIDKPTAQHITKEIHHITGDT